MTKTLQIIIAVYDTRLCGSKTIYCHTDYLPQCWSKVFFSFTEMFVPIVGFFLTFILQGNVETHLRVVGHRRRRRRRRNLFGSKNTSS